MFDIFKKENKKYIEKKAKLNNLKYILFKKKLKNL